MIPAELQACESELRKAVARQQYDEVERCLEGLRRLAEQSLKRATDVAASREIAGWALTTIEWARRMIVMQRQAGAEELEHLPQVDRFLDGSIADKQEVCLDL